MSSYECFLKRFNKDSLTEIYYKYVHYTMSTGVDGVIANDKYDLKSDVELILKKVYNGSYRFSKYKEKLISKGARKHPRIISIPTVRDRLVLKALHLTIQDIYPECSKTLIPQLMLDDIKSQVKSYKYKSFIKVDIKEFYPSINHQLLEEKLSSRIPTKALRLLITSAITNPTGFQDSIQGVPQGLSISNILAEIYLKDLDEKFSCRESNTYNRYVDDVLVFSTENRPIGLLDEMINEFSSLSLTCHPYDEIGSKTQINTLNKEFDFLGYYIKNRKLTVKKESVLRVENSIAKIINSHKYISDARASITQNKLNLRVTGCIFEGKRRGWLFYYSQMEDDTILYKLDNTVGKLLRQAKLDGAIKPKKFSKAFYECSRHKLNNHKYIVNFDGYSISEKRSLLSQFMDDVKVTALNNDVVNSLFSKRVKHLVKDLEEDIRENS
ncbi:Reverse transcriptase domain-containing protein [Vibrio chagasii]|nr:Reverse transcriptase domain-containing protein [Vibrio chagasii]CAH7000141.1 Reverse transcriptase domain-containing protein [Vibrio chagasii]CAH7025281.1 Reverse transcriptase domain-containing protein [Vibrio chagasii]CAH7029472.1 Reverse transcriptase domain-containing protein [Vibrio chagasii]CAH7216371.1 Reverse transcriptase domain-containing protein [Vibrio chagasii]